MIDQDRNPKSRPSRAEALSQVRLEHAPDVVGASRSDLRRILTAEYASLAVLGTVAGWGLLEMIARIGLPALFDAPVHVPYLALAIVAAFTVFLNTAMGLLVSRQVTAQRPLDMLRE